MSVRIRRYIPSFKRRKLDGGNGPTFLGAAAGEHGHDDTGAEAMAESSRQRAARTRDGIIALQKRRRWHVVKRADGDDTDDVDSSPETNGQIPVEIDQGDSPGVTVTVSVGLTLQLSTVSAPGSTFVTISTSFFTLGVSGGPSTSLPDSEPAAITSTTTASTSLLAPSSATLSAAPSSTPTISTIPTATTTRRIDTTTRPLSTQQLPRTHSTAASASPVSLAVQSAGHNMTALTATQTTSRYRTALLFTERATVRSAPRSSHTSTSRHSSRSSTSISTSILTTTTIFPAESEPTTPLDSPTSAIGSTDAGPEAAGSSAAPVNDRLPPILGGVFGGLAGLGLVLWALLFLLRRRRKNVRGVGVLNSGAGNGHQRGISQETGAESMGEMSQPQGSIMPNIFGTAAGLFSGRPSADTTSAPAKEQGFVKLRGRKLPSAYDNGMIATSASVAGARASVSEGGSRNVSGGTQPTFAASSSTRESISHDDDGIMQAPVPSPFPPSTSRSAMRTGSPALGPPMEEDEAGLAEGSQMPPPQIREPGEGTSRYGTPPPGAVRRMHSLVGTDGVGRSLASQDGSKTSRFTEDV
ncbi:hypothetical protein DRE_02113 [Drechslerella stenobrocha 248]|uniref:Uncharacterized protein n=1 Tax=Drechslerella stenobrocha 248 TaxID=1043628 RepID=W7HXU3_9PEZI|nr:hypothetical protein DRE_02113 [Drechslerella stenobrocha 248]